MLRISAIVLSAAASLTACAAPSTTRPPTTTELPSPGQSTPRRAIFTSIDALNERRVRETLPAESVPALLGLFEQGACAAYAVSAWPSKTAPSHAALWTGAYGDVSGIAANWQPGLPRSEHRLTDGVSGYAADWLRAEPIWITAARAGRRVMGLHPTQAPDVPGYPAITGARDASLEAARAAAARTLADTAVVVLNGYSGVYARDTVLTERVVTPRRASGWRNLDRLGATVPPLEIAWVAGRDSVFALIYGAERYDRIGAALERDAAALVTARAAPAERSSPRTRPLARHFSEPLLLDTPGGRAALRLRLFEMAPDASRFLLFQPAVHSIPANHRAHGDAYVTAIGGWVGNGAQNLLPTGAFGALVQDGGTGEAEWRYLESLEYVTRQFIRGSDWGWARGPALQIDYFPVSDETDHRWYGYVAAESPAYEPALAARFQELRARAWTLVDMRLAALMRLVAEDPSARLFVSGDHGMRPTWRVFNPNVALVAAGLVGLDSAGAVDLSRTRAYSPDGLYVMVNTTDWLEGIVPPDSAAAVLGAAERALRAVRDADGELVVTDTWIVLGPDSLGRGGPAGGGLYWETASGYHWSRAVSGPVVAPMRPAADHGFPSISEDMRTVLCAWGPSVTPRRVGPVRIVDAAPSVAGWLGIRAPRMAVGRDVLR